MEKSVSPSHSFEETTMNLKHLRYFLAVAEEQSFVHAANKVHIEPSPLSRAIKELEARLGVRLLHRAKGSVQLTWPGKVLEEEARNIMAQVENARTGFIRHRGDSRASCASA
jgi:DNA-binding transcriptional LysR family regulator